MPITTADSIKQLRTAFKKNNLTLYLGAGVSVANGLPTWEKLVLAMFFSTISEEQLGGWRPFSNYLFAIAEWHLANSSEPLDITARKLRKYYDSPEDVEESEFLQSLHRTLYGGLLTNSGDPADYLDIQMIRSANSTLDGVASLCEATATMKEGVKRVISYNYDDLLELVLGDYRHQSVFKNGDLAPDILPIYHVHGCVPISENSAGSKGCDIVFTEDQYHRVAGDPYYWSNLVQLESMSSSIGLMIGLSLSDRNMRRLLDAVQRAPIRTQNFALLQKPDKSPPENSVIKSIHEKAIEYLDEFEKSGIKSSQDMSSNALFSPPGIKSSRPSIKSSVMGEKGPRYRHEISGIIEEVKRLGREQQQYVMEQLGITPIWFDDYTEIPAILEQITNN